MQIPRDVTCRRPVAPYRAAAAVVVAVLTLALASCGNDDRILRVTCGQPGRERISADFAKPNVKESDVAVLNPAKFVPGTILRLDSGSGDGEAKAKAVYTVNTSNKDFWPRKSQTWAYGKVLGGDVGIEVDADVLQEATSKGVDLKSAVIGKTVLAAGDNSERSDLRDPVGLINADAEAVQVIRTAQSAARLVIVSGVFYSDNVRLFYYGNSIAVNTLKIGKFYLHISYDCPRDTTSISEHKSVDGRRPMLLLYIPVYFDEHRNGVYVDGRSLDIVRFDLFT